MPPFPDIQHPGIVHLRHHIAVFLGGQGKGAQSVQPGDGPGGALDAVGLHSHLVPHLAKQLVFQGGELFPGREHLAFQLFQLGGDEPLAAGEGLAAGVILGGLVGVGFADLDIVAKDLVVAHFQLGDAGALPLPLLDGSQGALAPLEQVPQLVDFFVKALPQQVPFPQGEGRLCGDGPVDEAGHIFQAVDLLPQLFQVLAAAKALQVFLHLGNGAGRLPQRAEIPAVGAAIDHPADEPLQVKDPPQPFQHPVPPGTVPQKGLDGILPQGDLGSIHQRFFQPLAEQPSAHGGAGVIQHPQK